MNELPVMVVELAAAEWDVANYGDLVGLLSDAYDAPTAIVDLSAVQFMDSACLAKLGLLQRQRTDRGLPPAAFVLSTPSLRRVFQVLGYEARWKLFETLESAVAAEAEKT